MFHEPILHFPVFQSLWKTHSLIFYSIFQNIWNKINVQSLNFGRTVRFLQGTYILKLLILVIVTWCDVYDIVFFSVVWYCLLFLFLFYIFSRCVPDNQRSFAIGVQFLVMRLLSFLPGPIIIGATFDSQCITWGYDGCGRKKNCLDYNMTKLSINLSIYGLSTLGKCL